MPIDDGLSIVIRMLNQKDYYTLNCCSGHVQNDIPQTYIQFMDEVSFPTIPKGFGLEVCEISNGDIVTNVSRYYERGLSEIRLQRQIWKACEALLVWTESLEDNDWEE